MKVLYSSTKTFGKGESLQEEKGKGGAALEFIVDDDAGVRHSSVKGDFL